MAEPKAQALATIEEYRALAINPQEVLDLLKQNMGNDRLSDRDLDRVTVPLGGGLSWSVPTLDGEDSPKTIDGIVVHVSNPRAYWPGSLEGMGSSPPDCSSPDGEYGFGDPAGECFYCPMNKWGSAPTGNGKACKEKRMIFMLLPGGILPIVVQAPSTSIQNIKKYLLRLTSSRVPHYGVYTSLGLEKTESSGKITYSRIVPRSLGQVPEDMLERVRGYVEGIKSLVSQVVTVDRDED